MPTPPPFNTALHPHGTGGKFTATSQAKSAAAGHPTGAWARGPIQSGAAHNKGAPDDRVKALQQALNRLKIGDEHGRPLLVDGLPGSHTAAAIKAFQKANGMAPTGVVDAKTMVAILTAHPAVKKAAPRVSKRPAAKKSSGTSKRPVKTAAVPVHKERVRFQ